MRILSTIITDYETKFVESKSKKRLKQSKEPF